MPIKYTAARFQIKFNTFAFACGGRWGKVTETSWEDKMWFKLRTKTIFGDNSRFSNVKLIWNLIDICVLVSSEECTRVLEHVYSESMMRCDGTAEIENAHLKTFHLFSPRSSFYPDVSKYAASIPVHLYSHPDIFPPPSSPSIHPPMNHVCLPSVFFCPVSLSLSRMPVIFIWPSILSYTCNLQINWRSLWWSRPTSRLLILPASLLKYLEVRWL